MWNLEHDFPAVLEWILPTQFLWAHHRKRYDYSTVRLTVEKNNFHEPTMRSKTNNAFHQIACQALSWIMVPKRSSQGGIWVYSCRFWHCSGERKCEAVGWRARILYLILLYQVGVSKHLEVSNYVLHYKQGKVSGKPENINSSIQSLWLLEIRCGTIPKPWHTCGPFVHGWK